MGYQWAEIRLDLRRPGSHPLSASYSRSIPPEVLRELERAIVPLNLPGGSKGKPHEMLGNRELNQCELYFDDVRIPKHYMFLNDADYYPPFGKQVLAGFNMMVACNATGLARAAFEEAFSYCNQRVQGGKLLKEHYSIKQKIFEMFSRVEPAGPISRRASN